MRGHFSLLLVAFLALTLSAVVVADEDGPAPGLVETHNDDVACETAVGSNLLQNPSFEGAYSAYVPPGGHPDCPTGVCNSVQTADGWTPYWLSPTETDNPDIRNPEFKPATEGGPPPPRVHHGERAQQYFSFSSIHEAGLYQQVPVTPGEAYCFSVWGHSWSSDDDNPETSDSELEQRVGIDPTGGTNWRSPDVVWGPPVQQYNEYGLFSVAAVAAASEITVFTWSRPIWPVRHNDVYWDQAFLGEVALELQVAPQELMILAEAGASETVKGVLDVDLGDDPGPTWSAEISPGGSPALSLDSTSGHVAQNVVVTADVTGLAMGTYSAEVVVSSNSSVPGSPVTIPVTLRVVAEVQETYLPAFSPGIEQPE